MSAWSPGRRKADATTKRAPGWSCRGRRAGAARGGAPGTPELRRPPPRRSVSPNTSCAMANAGAANEAEAVRMEAVGDYARRPQRRYGRVARPRPRPRARAPGLGGCVPPPGRAPIRRRRARGPWRGQLIGLPFRGGATPPRCPGSAHRGALPRPDCINVSSTFSSPTALPSLPPWPVRGVGQRRAGTAARRAGGGRQRCGSWRLAPRRRSARLAGPRRPMAQ
jgi:hypothetical protein